MNLAAGTLPVLSFLLPDDLLGSVNAYPQTTHFTTAWSHLPKPRRADALRPTASLTLAARAVTGNRLFFTDPDRPARTGPWPGLPLFIAPGALDLEKMTTVVRMWESQLEGHEGRNTLAPLLDLSAGGPVPLSEVLQRDEHGRIIGPHWAFRVAGWRIAEMLAAAPLPLGNGQEIPFLLDTEGGLISWHDPLVAEEEWIDKKSGQLVKRAGHAMDRIQVDVEPGPGGLALVAHLSPRISRVATNWKGIRNVYLNHAVNTEVILKAPVKVQWTVEDGKRVVKSVEYKGAAAKVVEKCGVSRLPEAPTALGELGPVRGIHRTQEHLIGTGPGARLKALLAQHAANVLGIEPITYDGTPVRISAASPKEFPAPCILPDKFPQALHAAKKSSMAIVVLYSSPEWKSRVLRQIGRDYDLPKLVESEDEQISHLSPGLSLVTLRIPELVLHGQRDRAKIINSLPWFRRDEPDAVLAAMCETSWPTDEEKARGIQDAKKALKEIFALQRIPSQFITMDSDPGDPFRRNMADRVAISRARKAGLPDPEIKEKDDNAVQFALASLMSDCGLSDNRLASAACHKNNGPTTLDRTAVLVGVFTRHTVPQTPVGGRRKPAVLAVTMVAMLATPGTDQFWPTLMYGDNGWRPLDEARAAYHRGPIGKPGHNLREDQGGIDRVRDYVETALRKLSSKYPIIVFAEQRKGLWPGMSNESLGSGAFPGSSLIADGNDIALVRVRNGETVPQPTGRIGGTARRPADPTQPAMPSTYLYSSRHGGWQSWLLAGESRQHKGGQRTGTQFTRRTLPPEKKSAIEQPFHGVTKTEYVVIHPGSWSEEQLVGLAARLSNQSASWDGRTNLPVPLHRAQDANAKHPQFFTGDEEEESDLMLSE